MIKELYENNYFEIFEYDDIWEVHLAQLVAGTVSAEICHVVLQALSNLYMCKIVLLTAKADQSCYVLSAEKHYIIPQSKVYSHTVCIANCDSLNIWKMKLFCWI